MTVGRLEDKRAQALRPPPLCVDLDGTLIAGDLLWESLVALLRCRPLLLFLLPLWLLRGKAHLKEMAAARAPLNVKSLPYREEVLILLRKEKEAGRRLVLATASNHRLARAVAQHLGLFDDVLASDPRLNLKGARKAAVLRDHFGPAGFDYIGDDAADLPVWAAARHGYVVHPSRRLLEQAAVGGPMQAVGASGRPKVRAALRLLRPHQWSKNLLLLVPLVLAHQLTDIPRWLAALAALLAFSCCASAVYVVNDLLDLEADRDHPVKRRRPLAAGDLPIPAAGALAALLTAAGFGLALLALPAAFVGMLGLYVALTAAYSLRLKREPLLDVFVLAGLYTLRILAGGLAVGDAVSGWLLAFAIFFFLSLALVKRYVELLRAGGEQRGGLERRGYLVEDLGLIQTLGLASGCMAVLTFCLYVNAQDVLKLYPNPQWLWAACMVFFYWITRVWFLARRRLLNEDPVTFAIRDPVSYGSGLIVAVVLVLAALP